MWRKKIGNPLGRGGGQVSPAPSEAASLPAIQLPWGLGGAGREGRRRAMIIPSYLLLCDHLDFSESDSRNILYPVEGGPLAPSERPEELVPALWRLAQAVEESLEAPEKGDSHWQELLGTLEQQYRGYLGFTEEAVPELLGGKGLKLIYGTFDHSGESRRSWGQEIVQTCQKLEIPVEEVTGEGEGIVRLLIHPIPDNELYEPYNEYKIYIP